LFNDILAHCSPFSISEESQIENNYNDVFRL